MIENSLEMATAKKDLQLFQESFEKFMKNHGETLKSSDEDKVKEITNLHETLLNNMNECIDDVIAKAAADSKMTDVKVELIKPDQTVLESFVQNPG